MLPIKMNLETPNIHVLIDFIRTSIFTPSVASPMVIRIIHYNDVIMSVMTSQITGVFIVCSIVGSGAGQRKHQSSVSLAFVMGIHRSPVNTPHKRPVPRKMFPFDDVIMSLHSFLSGVIIHLPHDFNNGLGSNWISNYTALYIYGYNYLSLSQSHVKYNVR